MRTPLFGFNAARPLIVDEVVERVVSSTREPLMALSEAAFLEARRLEGSGKGELAEWRALAHGIGRMDAHELRQKLEHYARHYAWDVAGNFDPRVYKTVSRAAAPLIGALLKPRHALKKLTHVGDLASLDDRVIVQGPVAHLRALASLGTLVFVPTHLSNLDSVVFGFALERSDLPPATYGAGKNLFTNPVLSFFMHNLGAYRVDRRLRFALYKDVLKAYSSVLIERGYHSLFFPGGTRSRSGAVERRLKLGLAGTGVEAFARTTERGRPQHVFFVPATINYLLTLEAETLIDDFLLEEGKHRYIIEDDESTRIARVVAFMNKLLGLDGSVVVRFSAPIDCFGNKVDERGRSYDAHDRLVDPKTYLYGTEDVPRRDAARDAQYTRELGERICELYKKDTVLMATHLVAQVAFEHLTKIAPPRADVFALLRQGEPPLMARRDLVHRTGELRDRLRQIADRGELVLGPRVEGASPEKIVEDALHAFAGYHSSSVLVPRGDQVVLSDPRLLLYYQNRLVAHGLAPDMTPSRAGPVTAAVFGA
ncbi:MAG: 1-acyl-sn-glycerol-3-phosphate acyltransferase [Myxococcales bacterium]|nr:1-acyl-sn-glycerol-3-phosphate acyltransferase [Myxococcales bacterium]